VGGRTALGLRPPEASTQPAAPIGSAPLNLRLQRRDLLGGLIHEYETAAAA